MQKQNKKWIPYLTVVLLPFAGIVLQSTDTIVGILSYVCPDSMCTQETPRPTLPPDPIDTPIIPPPPTPYIKALGSFSLEASEPISALIVPLTKMLHTFTDTIPIQKVAWTMRTDTPLLPERGQFGIKLECKNGGWLMLLSNSDNLQLTLQYANHTSDFTHPQSLGSLFPHTPTTLSLTKNSLAIDDTTYPINLTCDPYTLHLLIHLACDIPNPLAGTNVSINGSIENLTITH